MRLIAFGIFLLLCGGMVDVQAQLANENPKAGSFDPSIYLTPTGISGKVVCTQRSCTINDFKLYGDITAKALDDLKRLIFALRQATDSQHKQIGDFHLKLDSSGGSVASAIAIGRILRSEEIGAEVGEKCFSACVLVLAGAVTRDFFAPEFEDPGTNLHGNLGIHRPYLEVSDGVNSPTALRNGYQAVLGQIRDYLREMNVDDHLADAMLRIPPENVHYLTRNEADQYGLTFWDPGYQESLHVRAAKRFGLPTQEYLRRKALADEACPIRPNDGVQAMQAQFDCSDQVIKTGRAPQLTPAELARRAREAQVKKANDHAMAVMRDLASYCPGAHPPCTREPPPHLLDEAAALGLIQRVGPAQPARGTSCIKLGLGQGDAAIECQ